MFKLALDAGHHRHTSGKRCLADLDPAQTREWVLNARIADKVQQGLAGYDGIEILRVDDTTGKRDVSLAERVTKANEWGADFYLSIHHNAGINGGDGGGTVAYSHPNAGADTEAWRDELYEALIEHTGLRGNRATPKAESDLYVLRKTAMCAVLLEHAFMDSRTDVPILLTETFAQESANAIVEVVVRKAGLTKKATTGEPDAWAKDAWERAKAAGVMDGTRPRDPVTRQELAQVLKNLGLT